MNQNRKGLLLWIIFVFFIAPLSFCGIRMIQQRQQRDRAVVDRVRQEQQAEIRRPQQPVDSQPASDAATTAERPPTAAFADFRASVGRAFDALRTQGIVAEPKFEDCARCAVAAMTELLEDRNAPGGVYWHDQDDENFERGDDLNIGFVGREDQAADAIAQKLVAALQAEGLTVEWNGNVNTRVTVKVPWIKPQAAEGQVGKPAQRSDPPRVRLERVAHLPGEVGDPIADLVVVGRYAYLTDHDQLRVIDVSEPTRPRQVGSLGLEITAGLRSASDRHLYLASGQRLLFVDVSHPTAPRVAFSCDLGFPTSDVAVQGTYAYATDGESVRVIDISDPAAPKEVGRCAVDCGEAISVAGQLAFLGCEVKGVRIVDISDPTGPKQIGTWKGPADAMGTVVAGNLAFVTGGEDGVELWIGDISDPSAPKTVGRYGDGMSGGVAVQGNYAYVACGHLDVVNISNPKAPKLAGFYRDDECLTAWRVAVSGDYIYVTGEGKEGFSILRAVWADP